MMLMESQSFCWKYIFMFNLFPFPSSHLLLLRKEPPPVPASTSFSIEACFGNYPEILSPGEPERGFGRKSKAFWMAIYFSRWLYIFLDGNIFFQMAIYFSRWQYIVILSPTKCGIGLIWHTLCDNFQLICFWWPRKVHLKHPPVTPAW